MLYNIEFHLNAKVGFGKIEILHLGPECVENYFPEVVTSAVLFRAVVFIKYQILRRIEESHFQENTVLCFGTHLKSPLFPISVSFLVVIMMMKSTKRSE
jgi:hypothetical protein